VGLGSKLDPGIHHRAIVKALSDLRFSRDLFPNRSEARGGEFVQENEVLTRNDTIPMFALRCRRGSAT
jgi:hypothetical protein